MKWLILVVGSMDLLILLAVFVALLALAYVTYRNISNLDTRMKRIEDILRNAQVVAEPQHLSHTHSNMPSQPPVHLPSSTEEARASVSSFTRPVASPPQKSSPNENVREYDPSIVHPHALHASRQEMVEGWGGQQPVVPSIPIMIEKEDAEEIEEEDVEKDAEEGIEEDAGESIEEGVEDGVEEDVEDGVDDGVEEGVDDGVEEGVDDGVEEGVDDGVEEGVDEVVSLDDKTEAFESSEKMSNVKEKEGVALNQTEDEFNVDELIADVDESRPREEITIDSILQNMEETNSRTRSLDDLKVPELKEMLRKAGLHVHAGAKKHEMIEILRKNNQ